MHKLGLQARILYLRRRNIIIAKSNSKQTLHQEAMVCLLQTPCLQKRKLVTVALAITLLLVYVLIGSKEISQDFNLGWQKSVFHPVRPVHNAGFKRHQQATPVQLNQSVLDFEDKLTDSALARILEAAPDEHYDNVITPLHDASSHEGFTEAVTVMPRCVIRRASIDIIDFHVIDRECVYLKVEPLTPVCLFPDKRDVYVTISIIKTGIWESLIVKKYQLTLLKRSDIKVLDIGSHVGMYSLIAAQMGHDVVAVEPNAESVDRLRRAAALGNSTERITILDNSVTDSCGPVNLLLNEVNQGDTRVLPNR